MTFDYLYAQWDSMLFNSKEFALFLPIVWMLYWTLGTKRLKSQNILLLLASYCREHNYAIEKTLSDWNRTSRYSFYYFLLITILWYAGGDQPFIYFQF